MRAVVVFPFGLAVRSFLTVMIHRVPEKGSVIRPRSRCPGCGTELANRDNIPVVSWLMLRGKGRTCGMRISAVYPLTEPATGALFAAGSSCSPNKDASGFAPALCTGTPGDGSVNCGSASVTGLSAPPTTIMSAFTTRARIGARRVTRLEPHTPP